MFNGKRKLALLVVVVLVVLGLTLPAWAVETKSGDSVNVPEGKIQGPLFVAGSSIVVDADVDGDVFAAGQDITINGRINGDLIAAARSIRINGTINGNARCVASDIDLKGEVRNSLTAAASEVRLLEGSRVDLDTTVMAGNANFSGAVGRQLLGSGGTYRLNGTVGGNVRFWSVNNLKVGPAAVISGDLAYGSPYEAEITNGAKIAGETKWEQIQPQQKVPQRVGINWVAQIVWFIAGVLAWGVLALIFPRIWGKLSQNILQSPGAALGWGALTLLVTPLASLVLLITVIGIPLSLTLIMAYAVLLYAGKIIVGDAIGRYLARRFGWEARVHSIWPFMIGFAALILLGKIPIVGFFISLVVVATALGAVILAIYGWRRHLPPVVGTE